MSGQDFIIDCQETRLRSLKKLDKLRVAFHNLVLLLVSQKILFITGE
jgi:hypothetical protein